MKSWFRGFAGLLLASVATVASAEFHTYVIEQLFSNASGTVQFIVMHESQGMSAEYFWQGNQITSTSLGQTQRYTFPTNLQIGAMCNPYPYGCPAAVPTSTANTRVLIATQGFADLQIVTPDYVVPNGFLSTSGGTVNYAGVDQMTYASLPTDGTTALNRSGATMPNMATNFEGASGSVAAAAPTAPNYQGLWYDSPPESESGWGINFAHQGDVIFATWFTYDVNGKAWWLTMTANKTADGVYSGALNTTTGAPFNAFVPPATPTAVGTGTLTFTSATTGTFTYTVNGSDPDQDDRAADLRTVASVRVGCPAGSDQGDQLHGSLVGKRRDRVRVGREPDAAGDDHLRDLVHLRRESQSAVAVGDHCRKPRRTPTRAAWC